MDEAIDLQTQQEEHKTRNCSGEDEHSQFKTDF
jgi:hypothetical protein